MQDNDLIKRVRNNLPDAYEELLKQYKNMIYSIINTYETDYGDYKVNREDLFQEGCIALYDACFSYTFDRDVKFSTYVYVLIKRRISLAYKKSLLTYQMETYSLDNISLSDHCSNIATQYVCDNPIAYHARQERNEAIQEKLSKLREQDREIIMLRINNYSYEEIAQKLNIKKKRIDNRLFRLKKQYLKENKQLIQQI
ncbi:MAG: sigma-70 family RNA polymerase sigma factor [Erysipelotrichaceae bacterium]|nr:sigma-70 family RNA polymerase sigma factor [Erysipelotrichaceae bacterium]